MDDIRAERGQGVEEGRDPSLAIEMALPGEIERTRRSGERGPRRTAQRDEEGGNAEPRKGSGQAERHALRAALLQARHHLGDPQRAAGLDVEGGEADDARAAFAQDCFQGGFERRAGGQTRPEGARERRLQEHARERREGREALAVEVAAGGGQRLRPARLVRVRGGQ